MDDLLDSSHFSPTTDRSIDRPKSLTDLCVRVKSIQHRALRWQVILHVLMIARVIATGWHQETRSQVHLTLDQFRLQVFQEVSPTQSPVPVVCYVSAVHDLAEQVTQIFPWYLGVALEIIQQHRRADGQIADVERIRLETRVNRAIDYPPDSSYSPFERSILHIGSHFRGAPLPATLAIDRLGFSPMEITGESIIMSANRFTNCWNFDYQSRFDE